MMAFSILPRRQYFIIFTLISIATFCYSGCAEEDEPAQMVARAMSCFDNKFIYGGCNEAYRLNESGELNVPPGDATDLFCRGPCFAETQLVLNCVDNIFSSFLFNNRATIGGLRNALRNGCSYSNQRGNFNLGSYWGGETSIAGRPEMNTLCVFVLMCLCFLFTFYNT